MVILDLLDLVHFFRLLSRTWLFHPVWQVIILSVRLKCYVLL